LAIPALISAVTSDVSVAWRPLLLFSLTLLVVLRFGLLGGLTAGIVEGWFVKPLTFTPTWYSSVTYAGPRHRGSAEPLRVPDGAGQPAGVHRTDGLKAVRIHSH
jgi:hypothetical protein